ncbi:MAG: hypothetical protein Q8P26_02350 [Candidatus Levybacteria bacterium]|nr:hypothetical protein [Candidatus Levybacteria bacterium]
MVISERQRAANLPKVERKPTKPTLQLKAEQIFSIPNDVFLTDFGSNIQAVILFSRELSDPRENRTENRTREMQLELEEICKANDIDKNAVGDIDLQFAALVAKRNDHITQVNRAANVTG